MHEWKKITVEPRLSRHLLSEFESSINGVNLQTLKVQETKDGKQAIIEPPNCKDNSTFEDSTSLKQESGPSGLSFSVVVTPFIAFGGGGEEKFIFPEILIYL